MFKQFPLTTSPSSTGSCHLYGHSCLGAHGKRSSELSQPNVAKLVPQDQDKYSFQTPNLEDQLVNNRLYNRLINFIRGSVNLNSGSSSLPLNAPASMPITKLSELDQLSQQLSKRYDASRPNYDGFIKAYLRKSNDFLSRKKSSDLDDYTELY